MRKSTWLTGERGTRRYRLRRSAYGLKWRMRNRAKEAIRFYLRERWYVAPEWGSDHPPTFALKSSAKAVATVLAAEHGHDMRIQRVAPLTKVAWFSRPCVEFVDPDGRWGGWGDRPPIRFYEGHPGTDRARRMMTLRAR